MAMNVPERPTPALQTGKRGGVHWQAALREHLGPPTHPPAVYDERSVVLTHVGAHQPHKVQHVIGVGRSPKVWPSREVELGHMTRLATCQLQEYHVTVM